MVVNILENAIKYSTDTPIINVSTHNELDYIYVRISDKGMGMSIDVKKRFLINFIEKLKVMFIMLKDTV